MPIETFSATPFSDLGASPSRLRPRGKRFVFDSFEGWDPAREGWDGVEADRSRWEDGPQDWQDLFQALVMVQGALGRG